MTRRAALVCAILLAISIAGQWTLLLNIRALPDRLHEAEVSKPPKVVQPGARQSTAQDFTATIDLNGHVLHDPAGVTVALVEFADFQCPFCRRFEHETWPDIEREYVEPRKIAFVYKHLPLPKHNSASQAALASECAGHQGKFWEMRHALFANGLDFDTDGFIMRAETLQLRVDDFRSCLASQSAAKLVYANSNEGETLGIRATPTFLIGTIVRDKIAITKRIAGAQPIGLFRTVIDAAIAGARH